MKWTIITHNIKGLNDSDCIAKEREFLNSLSPRVDIILLQELKLRGRSLDNLGHRLMPGCASWILEAGPSERSWANPDAAGKRGVGILLAHKYTRLVTNHGSLYNDRVVWIKLEGIEGGNIGIACIYAPNISTERRHLWHVLMESLPRDCEWILGGDFNMTERSEDKSNDCGRGISDLEKLTWNSLLNGYQLRDTFTFQGGPRFSWNNGQQGRARRLARLDRFYTPIHSRLGISHLAYFIHGYSVGSDHTPVQLEICIGEDGARKSAFKWNLSYLTGEMSDVLGLRWTNLPEGTSFLQKLRNIKRFHRFYSKNKAKEFRKMELDTKANLELATTTLHEDFLQFGQTR